MALGGAILRLSATALRVLELLCAAVALAIYSYFLASLTKHHLPIATWERALEGISGAAVLYLLFAILLTLFLGGHRFFAFLMIFIDICFIGCFAAVASYNHDGAGSCKSYVNTPLGSGPPNSTAAGYGADNFGFASNVTTTDYTPNLGRACRLETAVFAVSIIAIFLFILSAIFQFFIARHHQKEKRYGPSPSNNYTSGTGRRPFWRRNQKVHNTRDAELATAGAGTGALRPSHDTGYTGTTMNGPVAGTDPKFSQEGYGYGPTPAHNTTTTTSGPYTTTTHGYTDGHHTTATNY